MSHSTELAGTVFAIYVISIIFKKWSEYLRFQKAATELGCKPAPRYPNWDPILGLDLFVKIRQADIRGRRAKTYNELHQKYGETFEMKALSGVHIQTSHPENIQSICTTAFNDWGVGPLRGSIGAPFIDRGIFMEDGEFWRHSRALVRPTFNRAEIADLNSFEQHVDRFIALFPKDGSTFDIQPLAKRLFLDTSTEFLFGQSMGSLLPEVPKETAEFMKAFDYAVIGFALRIMAGPLKPIFLLDPTWKKSYDKVHAFIDKHVAGALDRQRRITTSGETANDSKRYILLEQMAMEIQDPYELRAQILNVFLPARDTAALAISHAMFELARQPDVYQGLRTEVLSIGAQSLTFELLKSLKLTKAVINETLRLHSPVSRIDRVALRDTVLPVGGGPDGRSPLFVPKSRVVDMDLYCVQRDPNFWGADADDFRPARWNEGRPLWEAKWQYEPFLGGVRMCPAQQQVLTQVAYLLVRLVKEFRAIENRDEVLEYVEEVKMTAESRNGVKIALIPA